MSKELRPIQYCGTCPQSKRFPPSDPLYADAMDYYDEVVGGEGKRSYPGSLNSLRNILLEADLFKPDLNADQLNLLQRVRAQLKIIKDHPECVFPILIDCPQKHGWYLSIDHCPDTCKDEKSML